MTLYTKKARDYAAHRLPYATACFESLFESTGMNRSWNVADIGSGTGNVSRFLAGRVNRVFAVEPDDAMRYEAENAIGLKPGYVSVEGTAEATMLADRSVDLITVGQALHWFDTEPAHREFDRILKSDGRLAVLWNKFGTEDGPDVSRFLQAGKCDRLSFPVSVREDWERFIGGARSVAANPNVGDEGYDAFERERRAFFDAQATDGLIEINYSTELVVGRMKRITIRS